MKDCFQVHYCGYILEVEEVYNFGGDYLTKYKADCKELGYVLEWDTIDLRCPVDEFKKIVDETMNKMSDFEFGLCTKGMKTLGELTDMEEVTQEIESVEWIKDIQFIKEQVYYIAQALPKEVTEVELDIDALDTYAYKAKILPNNDIEMVKIGKIDSFGKLELFAVETYPPIVPNFYQPEFYYLGMRGTEVKRYGASSYQPNPEYKKFVPKNVINQIVVSKEDIKYSTGYINADGVAIYYDQLP